LFEAESLFTALGFDIGGANTKAVCLQVENGKVLSVGVAVEYFPVWEDPDRLSNALLALKETLSAAPDVVGVTMTAELSDAYQTKREGVNRILSCVKTAFPHTAISVLNTDAQMVTVEIAKANPLSVSAANWAATGWLVAQHLPNAVVVDIGSTSTSIVPIASGKLAAKGKTDLDKLVCGELVYTGSLRTNVAAIVHSIPLRGGVAGVSSELFAQSGDVHLILGNMGIEDYTSETADGRGKTLAEAYARLARVVCADTEMLTQQELFDMARYTYAQQLKQVAAGLSKVYAYTKALAKEVPVVVTGLGRIFLARKAAQQIGADKIIELDQLLPKQAVIATPAAGIALMAANHFTGEANAWM
jgi:probable H4MPT-linked C1 transfer pathway protein